MRGPAQPSVRGGGAPAFRRLPRAAWLVAAAFFALELSASARYGFHRDELYFIVAGRHPAFGYVDQPPLAPLLTRLATAGFGTSPAAIRILPALAGACLVLTTAITARLLGGHGRAQVLAAVAIACAPVTLAAAHLANTTIYDLLAWTIAVACTMAAVRHGRSRAWLGAGAAVGLGLENKDLLLLLVAALLVGLLVSGHSGVLRDRWLWAGAATALVLWAPNLIWQATHGWPEQAVSSALHAEHSTGSDYLTVLPAQFLYLGLPAVPLALVGLRQIFRERSLRFLAVAAVVVMLFVVGYVPGRPYYPDGLLGLVFAAGAVAVERSATGGSRFRRWMLAPPIGLLATVVVVLPVLPESALRHIAGIHKLNYDLTETIGWPQLASAVGGIVSRLPADQRAHSAIFTGNYGEASALEIWGRGRLPPVLSGHNNYWLWGPGHAPDATVISVGAAGQLRPYFASCRRLATFRSPQGVDNDENGTPIDVCTGPSGPWSTFWPALRHYG